MSKSTFESPGEVDQFVGNVIQKLRQAELHDAAKSLEDWRTTAYATSSELLGELGLVIQKIQKQYKTDKSISQELKRLIDEVHRDWRSI